MAAYAQEGKEGKEAEPAMMDGLRVRAEKKEYKSYSLSAKVYASAEVMYDALTDVRDIMRYTGAPATGKAEEGAEWSIMDGAVSGKYESLKRGEEIVTSWRFSTWAEGDTSKVTITISSSSPGTCVVELQQEGIPATDKFGHQGVLETVTKGWGQYIFGGIEQRLGFGMDML